MTAIIFLILGMIVLTSVQIEAVYYPFFMSRAGTEYTPAVLIQSSFKRKMWRLGFTLAGLGLLFLATHSCLAEMPDMYHRIVALTIAFVLWIILLRVSFRVFLNTRAQAKAATFACAFMIPLALVGLLCVMAYVYPGIDMIFNKLK